MKTKLAICVAAFSLIAPGANAVQSSECEVEIQLVQDMISDPVIAAGDPATLAQATDLLNTAITQCDGTEEGRVAALASLASAKTLLGHGD